MRQSRFLALVTALWPALTAAHPGHGAPGDGWTALHYLTEPLHLPAALGALLLGALAWGAIRSRVSGSGS